MSDFEKYNEIFDYLSVPDLPLTPEPAIIFGRNDARVAHAAGDLMIPGLVEIAVITGGVGKDTGDLLERGYTSEADYLGKELQADADKRGYNLPGVILEEKATHGGQNAEFSLNILKGIGRDPLLSVTAVAHATSARRLARTIEFKAAVLNDYIPTVYTKPSAYDFNAENPADRNEAAAEMMRLITRPSEGLLLEQPDLPQNLVDFVTDQHG